ncbi:hypothetical protein [Kiloniella sp.]|uniref:hypothetical protein n=1 Tax=Kiloniella sp. TaxID=1938587 RepID=UPI003B02AC76
MEMKTEFLDHKTDLSLEGIDLTTAARLGAHTLPERGRLSYGDLMDIDLCSAPLLDTTGLSDVLSGDLSGLIS